MARFGTTKLHFILKSYEVRVEFTSEEGIVQEVIKMYFQNAWAFVSDADIYILLSKA